MSVFGVMYKIRLPFAIGSLEKGAGSRRLTEGLVRKSLH